MNENRIWLVRFERDGFVAGRMTIRNHKRLYPFIEKVQKLSTVRLDAVVEMKFKLKGEKK